MKPLVDTTQNHQFPLSKPLSYALPATNAALNTAPPIPPSSCYEPTSVLDLRSSPSSAARRPESAPGIPAVSGAFPDDPSSLLTVEEWDDSMFWSLGEKDDPAPDLKCIPHFAPPETPNPNLLPFPHFEAFDSSHFPVSDLNPSVLPSPNPFFFYPSSERTHLSSHSQLESPFFDRLQLEQLIHAAECFESNDPSLAHAILARLNQLCPVGKPLQRAAFYFKEALESLLFPSSKIGLSPFETLQKIGAYKEFSYLSPVSQFANFTANQAILEAVAGSGMIHVIDFDIGLGGQWPPLMQEIALRFRDSPRVLSPPSLRITAIVEEESMEMKLAEEVLRSFARELGIRFQIEFVHLAGLETLARFAEDEAVAVNLSPSIFRRIDGSNAAGFFRILRRISPRIAVLVDGECRRDASGTPSFRRVFIDRLEFFAVLLESLDAAAAMGGAAEQMRRIERYLLRPRIFRAVAAAGDRTLPPWRELFSRSGMAPIPLSELAESQAECLLRGFHLSGFHVAKRESSMLLCWQGRELVATSAWRCG